MPWKRSPQERAARERMRDADRRASARHATRGEIDQASADWHQAHDDLRAAQGKPPLDRWGAHRTEAGEVSANPSMTPTLDEIEYDADGYATTAEGQAWKHYTAGKEPADDAEADWFAHFREDAEWIEAAEHQIEAEAGQ